MSVEFFIIMQILEGAIAINLDVLGRFLSMMDFLVVVPFLDHLGLLQEFQHQRFDLMSITSLIEAMDHIILLAHIRLDLYFKSCSMIMSILKKKYSGKELLFEAN